MTCDELKTMVSRAGKKGCDSLLASELQALRNHLRGCTPCYLFTKKLVDNLDPGEMAKAEAIAARINARVQHYLATDPEAGVPT